jgi:hypothetical protein
MQIVDQAAVWRQHAGQFHRVGSPLRPTAQDGTLMMAALEAVLFQSTDAATVAVLGVTPEVVRLPWPRHVGVQAFDHSADMIATHWQPPRHGLGSVRLAGWQSLPLPDRSVRAIVGDGALNCVRAMDYPHVLSELARVLEPGGRLCLRCFIRPDQPESLDAVAADQLAGKIGSFHALKFRIAMALCEAPTYGVAVSAIRAAFDATFPDRPALAQATGWPMAAIDTIDAYRDAPTIYTFPTFDGLRQACAPHFIVESVVCGDYELAARCPTVRLRPCGLGREADT